MLKTGCINPLIMNKLALCGHGDTILIADGNYPLDSKTGDHADRIYLGLSEGKPTVTEVLEALSSVAAFERAQVMIPTDGDMPDIFAEFKTLLGDMELEGLERYEFYGACCEPSLKMAVSTGEKRVYANILLTIGVV